MADKNNRSSSGQSDAKDASVSHGAIRELLQLWKTAIASGKVENVLKLYADDAVLLPTLSSETRTDHEGLADYFRDFLAKKPKPFIVEEHVIVHGDIASNTGTYDFQLESGGTTSLSPARYTFVYKKLDAGWKIVQHHSSLRPGE